MTEVKSINSSNNNGELNTSTEPSKAAQEVNIILAAVHTKLAQVSHHLGSANPSDPDPETMNWPWVPNADGTYSIPSFNINPGDSLDEMLLKLEQAQNYLANNPDDVNGYIAYLKDVAIIGQNYQNLTPAQQNVFNSAVNDIENSGSGSGSFAYELMRAVMYGTLYKNGVSGSAATITFLGQLVTLFSGMPSTNQFFSRLAEDAQTIYADIVITDPTTGAQEINPDYIKTATDPATGQTYQYMADNWGNPTDFATWALNEMNRLGSFFMDSNTQQSQSALYAALTNNIMASAGNTWEAMMMLLALLLNGPDNDISRQINGVGHTINLGQGLTNQLHQLMSLMQTGDMTNPATVQKLMGLFSSIQQQVDSNPLLSGFASQFDSTLNNILGMSTTTTNPTEVSVSAGWYTIPAGTGTVTIDEGGKEVKIPMSSSPQVIYIAGSGTLTYPPGTYTMQQLGYTGSVGGLPVNGLGDFTTLGTLLASLQAGSQGQDIATSLTSLISLVGSPNSALQNEISTDTNTKSTLEGMVKVGFQVITNVNDQTLKAMQNANS